MLVFSQETGNRQLDTNAFYTIELTDGTVFTGSIIRMDSLEIEVKTPLITSILLPKSSIDKITPVNISQKNLEMASTSRSARKKLLSPQIDSITGKVENPHPTRYFFSPSAYQLKKGERYYQNAYLVMNSFNFGISDHFSFGFGVDILTSSAALSGNLDALPIFFITPKWGFEVNKNIHLGLGAFAGSNAGIAEDDSEFFGLGYGLFTYGNKENNFTIAVGEGKFIGKFDGRPTVTLSGMYRIGSKTSLVTENWFVPFIYKDYQYNANWDYTIIETPKYLSLISYGLRYFDRNFSADFGFVNNKDIVKVFFIGIPYVDIVIKF